MVPCPSHLPECHWVVGILKGTVPSTRSSLLGLQMLLSRIVESVKVSLGKDASQIWGRRRVPHGPSAMQIKDT